MRKVRRREAAGLTPERARRVLDALDAFAFFGVPPVEGHPLAALWDRDRPLWVDDAVTVLEHWEAGERFGLEGEDLAHFEGPGNPVQHKGLLEQCRSVAAWPE